MGSIADKLIYLQETKTAIKNAIVAKGITVDDTDSFRSYADKIGSISSGNTGTPLLIDSLPKYIVGTELTNENGLISGFTSKSYIDDQERASLVGKSYYIKFKFTGDSIPNQSCIIHGEEKLNLEVTETGELDAYNFREATTTALLDSIELNTWYYVVIRIEQYNQAPNLVSKKYYVSTVSFDDAKANGLKATLEPDYNLTRSSYSTYYGRSSFTATTSQATTAVIDFNNTCIKYNDSDTIYKVYRFSGTIIQ